MGVRSDLDPAASEVAGSIAWWDRVPIVAAALARRTAEAPTQWYRLGDGVLGLRSEDAAFRARFHAVYEDCAGDPPGDADLPVVRCTVRCDAGSDLAVISIDDPEPLDPLDFTLQLFADRGYRELRPTAPGWRLLGDESATAVAAFGPDVIVCAREAPWQRLIANLAVNRLLRLQRGALFFHAAAASLHGRGALLMGPKGSGKTTLALALATRGHDFLGDELAVVRAASNELVPLRRAASVRPGPAGEGVRAALDRAGAAATTDPFPDGSVRRCVSVSRLLPGRTPAPAPLDAVFLLRGLGPNARCTPLSPGRERLRDLTPLAVTLWDSSPERLLALVRLLSAPRWFALEAGTIADTVTLIERTLER